MVRGDDKARGASELGSLPLFLSLFLLLLAFFIFLNSISTRESGKSDNVLDSVRSSFAAALKGGTGDGVFEGEPGLNDDAGLRDQMLEAFNPLLSITSLKQEWVGNPIFVEFETARLFRGGSGDPVLEFRDFAARICPVLAQQVVRRSADIRFWFPTDMISGAAGLSRQRLARIAEIMIASGCPGSSVSIGFRQLDRSGVLRIAVHIGPEAVR